MTGKVGVIGSGFAGLAAATVLAAEGREVHVFEKNAAVGGRARQLHKNGFVFDMGPSWYWMPDVFERFFQRFGRDVHELYTLVQLDPAFTVFFGRDDRLQIPSDYDSLRTLFDERERGAATALDRFMREAEVKYRVGVQDLVYMPGESLMEFFRWPVLRNALRLDLFQSLRKHVQRHFRDPGLRALMEFPVLFLGASPARTPALYSMMNYAGLKLGTWYPMGGFGAVINAMYNLALEHGVQFHPGTPVTHIAVDGNKARRIVANGTSEDVHAVVAAADYHHVEHDLLNPEYRRYSASYWETRTMAPSCLLYYVGLSRKVSALDHHNLFFDADMDAHTNAIYRTREWPADPLFYVCCPSRTDAGVAPDGHENLFILVPVAPGLQDTAALRAHYFDIVIRRIERLTGQQLTDSICLKETYGVSDFTNDYNAYKGNAYGLANTLRQTALLKPRIRSGKVSNLFFAGHLTVPGPGVPPALISGQIAAQMVIENTKS